KEIRPDLTGDATAFIARFMREADMLRRLQHPNIITLLEMVADVEQGHFLVMEYVAGGSLWDELQTYPQLPIGRALQIAQQIASALMVVHEQGIIHRDIKPSNVLIADDKSPRLCDFGVVYVQDGTRITETGGVVGTLDYLAPEILNGEKITPQADIWAFGVMLYEMIGGKRPFPSDNPSALITAILTKPPADLFALRPDAPLPLIRLIEWMLVKNPQDRIGTMTSVHQTITDILAGTDSSILSAMPSTPNVGKAYKRIGSLPKIFTHETFHDRNRQQADLANAILEGKPFISVYGRGGIGKTGLVCKVLGTFENAGVADGIAYLRANSTPPLNISTLLNTLGEFVPPDATFHDIRLTVSASVVEKTRSLLDGLVGGRYVVYIDNLETLQHPENHGVIDDDLRQFLETVLEMRLGSTLTLIITSRYPIPFPNTLKAYETIMRIDEGLPEDDALRFLREIDSRKTLPETDNRLKLWVE
ncbi:MAG TPA: serine/threonine-protein kinase, partial [Aggregatilineales bacterium]|nr:serine/threonine-protein kinase [Aggregatilineales bacterium]